MTTEEPAVFLCSSDLGYQCCRWPSECYKKTEVYHKWLEREADSKEGEEK